MRQTRVIWVFWVTVVGAWPSDQEEIVDAEAEDIADSDLIIGEHLGLAVARY